MWLNGCVFYAHYDYHLQLLIVFTMLIVFFVFLFAKYKNIFDFSIGEEERGCLLLSLQ